MKYAIFALMKSKPGVWFATHEQVASYVKSAAASLPSSR
jgi:hypothetical protein